MASHQQSIQDIKHSSTNSAGNIPTSENGWSRSSETPRGGGIRPGVALGNQQEGQHSNIAPATPNSAQDVNIAGETDDTLPETHSGTMGEGTTSNGQTSSARNHVVRTNSSSSLFVSSNGPQSSLPQASNNRLIISRGPPAQSATTKPRVPVVSGFPSFIDGDVLIVSPTGKKWRLHSLILTQASTILREIFTNSAPVDITAKMRKEGRTIKWKLEMEREPQADHCDPGSLKFKKFVSVGVNTRPRFNIQNFNGLGQKPCFDEVYDNFFRCVYNIPPSYVKDNTKDENKNTYIAKVTDLLQAASYLEGIAAIRVNVEAHLLRMSHILWLHIEKKPEGWIHIAGMLQSDVIFRECMVHLVGRFHIRDGIDKNFLSSPAHGELGQIIWELIVKKAGELKDLKLFTERHLVEFFPPRMIHLDTEDVVPGRAVYTNDIYFWIALSLVRQYFTSAFMANFHHRASDGGLAFYRSINEENPSYLSASTLKRFHVCFDMSTKARQVLVEAVEDFKKDMRPVVRDLLIDRSQNSSAEKVHDHFTCTEISEEELPWNIYLQRVTEAAEAAEAAAAAEAAEVTEAIDENETEEMEL